MISLSKLAAVARAEPKAAPVSSVGQDQGKLSRRAALRRIGMTSGIAFVGLLTIDDLARVASKKLEQNELTRGIAEDFKSAGVAFADTPGDNYYADNFPVDCQDRSDKALMNTLTKKLGTGVKAIGTCLSQCAIDFAVDPEGRVECVKGCVVGGGYKQEAILVEDYVKCCYLLCDSNQEGSKCCKYGDANKNKACAAAVPGRMIA